jgi:hypothetical protein
MWRVLSICIVGFVAFGAGIAPNRLWAADVPCGACHAAAAESLTASAHGKATAAAPDAQCESCHGDGQAHLAAPGPATIRTFSNEPAQEQNAVCANCHTDTHNPETNAHNAAGKACSGCHGIHVKKSSNISRL